MENRNSKFGAPEGLVLIGASVFILVLAVSAFFEPDIRWLHFFQAWMYIATIGLSVQGNRWDISSGSPLQASGIMQMFLQPPSFSTGSKNYLTGSIPGIWRAQISSSLFRRGSPICWS
jgi:hypothetical protein